MAFCQFCGASLGPAPSEAAPNAWPSAGPAHDPRPAPPLPPQQAPAPAAFDPTGTSVEGSPFAAASPLAPEPAAVPEASAFLVVIGQDGTPGREYPLHGDQIDIGREEGDIQLPNDPYVSPRHARLRRRQGRFSVRDLESLNGVFLRLRQAESLENGDLVLIGLEVLRFEVVTGAEKGLGAAVDKGTRVFGSPAAPRHARLSQRTVEGVARDVVYLTRDEFTIGRESGDLVFTADPFMSRRHAAIRRNGAQGFEVRDLGSSNGTYLAIRGEVPLEPGDHIRIGQHLFRLDVDRQQ